MASNLSCNEDKCGLNEAHCPAQNLSLAKETVIIISVMSIHLIFTVAAVFGSYLVIRAFHKFHSLRTASNVILVSLSTADGLLAIPLIFGIVQMSLRLLNGSDAECSSGPLGKITSTSSFFLISVIILHLALISVERLIAVKFALRYHTIVTNPQALIVALAMWLFAATVTITFATTLVANSGDIERFRQAMDPHCKNPEDPLDHDLNPLIKGLLIFLVMFLLVIPLVIILCSYGYIFIVSYKQRKNIRGQNNIPGMATAIKHEMKGASTLAIVVAVCLLSIVPLIIVTGLRFFGELPERCDPKRKLIKFIVFDLATGLNTICNPLVYGWRNEKFRTAFRKLLKCS